MLKQFTTLCAVWRCISYNIQGTRATRTIPDILSQLQSDIACLQSTQETTWRASYDGTQQYITTDAAGYHIIHWPWRRSEHVNASCGVAIALKKRRFKLSQIREVYVPPWELQGRVGAVRVQTSSKLSWFICTLYLPPCRDASDKITVQKILQWLENQLQTLPRRCLPMIGTDANGRTGYTTTSIKAELTKYAVGNYNQEFQNYNGQQFSELCQRQRLVLVNTFRQEGAGPTWFHPGRATRIDYIAIPAGLLSCVSACRPWYRTGQRIQASSAMRLMDHVPLVMDVSLPLRHQNCETPVQKAGGKGSQREPWASYASVGVEGRNTSYLILFDGKSAARACVGIFAKRSQKGNRAAQNATLSQMGLQNRYH
jgi:exonuclease III